MGWWRRRNLPIRRTWFQGGTWDRPHYGGALLNGSLKAWHSMAGRPRCRLILGRQGHPPSIGLSRKSRLQGRESSIAIFRTFPGPSRFGGCAAAAGGVHGWVWGYLLGSSGHRALWCRNDWCPAAQVRDFRTHFKPEQGVGGSGFLLETVEIHRVFFTFYGHLLPP